MAKVLIVATNYGSWGEELQAPWDIIKAAKHEVTLTTPLGKKPLPLKVSVDPDFVDPIQHYKTNPPDVCKRIKQLTDSDEWAHSIKYEDAKMADYDAIVLTGGLGAMIDLCNNVHVHNLLLDAYYNNKLIGGLCYAITALVFTRNPRKQHKSILYGKKVTAHPRSWDFLGADFTYEMYGETPDNQHTDVHTPGFLWPAEDLTRDAVGPDGEVICDGEKINRENPCVIYDWPFVTGTSVESSIAYGKKIVEVLRLRELGLAYL